jgi:hypothetical protein
MGVSRKQKLKKRRTERENAQSSTTQHQPVCCLYSGQRRQKGLRGDVYRRTRTQAWIQTSKASDGVSAKRTRRAASCTSVSSESSATVDFHEQPSVCEETTARTSGWPGGPQPPDQQSVLQGASCSAFDLAGTYNDRSSFLGLFSRPKFNFESDKDFLIASLQYRVTSKLLQWLVPVSSQPSVQADFLHDVLYLWRKKNTKFRQELGERYDTTSNILGAWIKERLVFLPRSRGL